MHVAGVADFVLLPVVVVPQHHVGRPSAAADQDVLSVDLEQPVLLRVQFRGELADSEIRVLAVR